jgi:hypothetical protein
VDFEEPKKGDELDIGSSEIVIEKQRQNPPSSILPAEEERNEKNH